MALSSGFALPASEPNAESTIRCRSEADMITWRIHGARKSTLDDPFVTPGACLLVSLTELEVVEGVAGDLVECDPRCILEAGGSRYERRLGRVDQGGDLIGLDAMLAEVRELASFLFGGAVPFGMQAAHFRFLESQSELQARRPSRAAEKDSFSTSVCIT